MYCTMMTDAVLSDVSTTSESPTQGPVR